jgi:hypothetical protein
LRCLQKPRIYIPAHVPIEDKNISNGLGAEAAGGWSVATVKEPKCASTRDPPGKSMIISIVFCLQYLLLFYY